MAGLFPSIARMDAHADEIEEGQRAVDDARVSLDEAEAQLSSIVAECESLASEIDALQGQIDASAAEVLDAQQQMLEGKAALGEIVSQQYRDNAVSALLSMLLGSTNMSEFLRNLEYVDQIMGYRADEIAAQKERRQRFEDLSAELSSQKDQQESALAQLEEKREEAERIHAQQSDNLAGAEAAQAARLEALRAQAEQFNQSDQAASGEIAEDANTVDREEVVPEGTPVVPNPDGESSGSSGGSQTDPSLGWLTGTASAYGGSSDPNTPNPGITATGAVCDDWSMGVAVPMSLPNYRSYFGRTVEISYGGMTVYAVVNDCGYMGGGSRVLDLQPGVFKAFGFGDCFAWGLRTVSYRFL